MTSRKPSRTRTGIFVWTGIVFILLVSCGVGLSLVGEGLGGRRALAHGPLGTFTPTGRECGKTSCAWLGTFTGADGTVTEEHVELKDAEEVRRDDPMPAAVTDVRLDDEANRPTAYTADYSWYPPVVEGALFPLVGLGISAFLLTVPKRQRPTAASP
ncbi:hypothetical protein [Streptomyces nitrosporeus]|uniref:hypothetical protein n=1 Tax=Streptomyces nitrosporeus TaxID=28894 RepID=UPI00332E5540